MNAKRRWIWLLAASALAGGCTHFTRPRSASQKPAPAADRASASSVWKDGKWMPVRAGEGTPAGELGIIRGHLDAGRPKAALKAAKKFLRRYSGNDACEEAMLLAAQAEMDRGHYYAAFERFSEQVGAYPNGKFFERALTRQYEIADAFLEGRKQRALWVLRVSAEEEGLDILTRIAERAPGTVIAEKSVLRAADFYYEHARLPEAVDQYDFHQQLFGKSPRAEYSMLRAARATYGQYRGHQFDDTPLIDAQQRFREFARKYPAKARRVNVPTILKQISSAIVHRVFVTAAYYERVGRVRSATFYYRRVVERYPTTHWATRAKEALARLGVGDRSAPPTIDKPGTRPAGGNDEPLRRSRGGPLDDAPDRKEK